jgi:hypothetical protein
MLRKQVSRDRDRLGAKVAALEAQLREAVAIAAANDAR